MSPYSQTVILRKTLSKCLSKKSFNQLLYRTYFNYSNRTTHNSGTGNGSQQTGNRKVNSNVAIVGSGSVLLAYYYLSSSHLVSLDSVKGIKQFSSSSIDSNYNTDGSNKDSLLLLSDNEVNIKLHNLEASSLVNRAKGIIRYDISQLPSNHPIEDNHVEQIITTPSKNGTSSGNNVSENDLYFFGIFDGHSGPFTSAKLSTDLVKYVATHLNKLYKDEEIDESTLSKKFDKAIENGFLQLDNDIVNGSLKALFEDPSKQNVIDALPAISGSCALLSVYNSQTSTLKVAVTGDSRALICDQEEDGNWTVKSLSTDQTGDNLSEVERIRSEHPDEPNAVRNGRVLGSLQPSRAFGDYRYKLNDIEGRSLSELPDHVKIYFRKEPRFFLTPPYVTAKPEITTTKINVKKTKFMVLGSDGLFELLSNEEIAGLVVRWLENNQNKMQNNNSKKPLAISKKLPAVADLSVDKEAQRPAFRYKSKSKSTSSSAPEYLLEDSNVSTHLIRNALSAGGSKEYVSTLVSIPSPMSRRYRDDLTVTVVFFDEPSSNSTSADGSVITNIHATTPPKPKL